MQMVWPSIRGFLWARQRLGRNPRLLELQASEYFYGWSTSGGHMSRFSAIVYVIDDDPSIRQGIKHLLGSVGLESIFCDSAKEFLANRLPIVPSCMLPEVRKHFGIKICWTQCRKHLSETKPDASRKRIFQNSGNDLSPLLLVNETCYHW
jgi:hypothetical protein